MTLRAPPVMASPPVLFCTSMSLSDSFVSCGSPGQYLTQVLWLHAAATRLALRPSGDKPRLFFVVCTQGAVFSYNSYEFFPIKAPAFWIPAGIPGREPAPILSGHSFLVDFPKPLEVHVRARFFREVSGGALLLRRVRYTWRRCGGRGAGHSHCRTLTVSLSTRRCRTARTTARFRRRTTARTHRCSISRRDLSAVAGASCKSQLCRATTRSRACRTMS
jgi:hypothetical protein